MKNYLIAGLLAVSSLSPLSASASILADAGFNAAQAAGSFVYSGANLNSATSVSFGASSVFSVSAIYGDFLSNSDMVNQSPLPGTYLSYGTVQAGTVNISSFSAINNFLVWGSSTTPLGNRFSFDLTSLTQNTSSLGVMDLYGEGLFKDSTGYYTNSAASIRLSAQQLSGAGVSYSFSWATPPEGNNVPEPATLGLFGIGLLGFAASRFRKAA